jgi:AcrR family transcriptional regulator
VIPLHSRDEAGTLSISINSCSQPWAERAACSDPNNWVTAVKNADNSRSAIDMRSGQRGSEVLDGCLQASGFIIFTSRSRRTRELLLTGRRVPAKTENVSESVDKITGDGLRLQLFCMPTKNQKTAPRKPRTDAQRNRERILEVAKEAFTRFGASASLDDIAKEAGVGAGTLYRHFPTRDALIEAVYRTEVEKLATAERRFAAAMSPIEALRAWMLLFVDYIATKQIIASALSAYVGGPSKLYEGSRPQIQGAIDTLVKRAIKNGDIRRDLDAFDLLRALSGVSHVASGPDWQPSARRLVDILITGSRPLP